MTDSVTSLCAPFRTIVRPVKNDIDLQWSSPLRFAGAVGVMVVTGLGLRPQLLGRST
ncbi:MAG: hypothetical protein ABR543_04260 [Gemmatimonadaceae bacterium]